MARFKILPHSRRPSLGELLGISQASHQVSRKYHLRILRDSMSPFEDAQRRAERRRRYCSPQMMFARFLARLFR